MGEYILILVAAAVLFLFILFISMVKRYKRCPSDRILVVYGKVGKGVSGEGRSAKCIHGGAAFIWPVIQDFAYLDLTPIDIQVGLENALSKQNIRVNVPSRFLVGISTDPGVMDNAAERLLGQTQDQVRNLAADVIFGQLRVVIATMDIEEINSDREKFLTNVSAGIEHELAKIGLKLINVNVTDITDEAGYIEALGKEATAKAINEAKVLVAERDRDGSIGAAEAQKEQRIKVASANADANVGEADAKRKERIAMSAADAEAVKGENDAKVTIANSSADRRVKESEALKIAVAAEEVNKAKALEETYLAQRLAEVGRAEKSKATQYADVVVPTEIEKQRIEIQAEADAERIRRLAKGESDALFFKMQAEANGNLEILSKQAQGFKNLVEAASNNPNDAVMMMIADKLPEIVKLQVDAIKNIKIDKVTVWDNLSGGKDGKSSNTANFLSGMLGSLPPFEDIFKLAGMQLPEYIKSKQLREVAEPTKPDDEKSVG